MKKHIKELRTEKGLVQQVLADIYGISRQTVNAIKNDKYDPTLMLSLKMAEDIESIVDKL